LHTVHIDAPVLFAAVLHELNSIVKDARDVFLIMIFQVVSLIYNTLIFEIVFTVIARAVDYVSDSSLFKSRFVLCNFVAAQEQKSIQYLATDAPPDQIFILFSGGPFEIKVLIIKLGCASAI
jgi:hypothetical protein